MEYGCREGVIPNRKKTNCGQSLKAREAITESYCFNPSVTRRADAREPGQRQL